MPLNRWKTLVLLGLVSLNLSGTAQPTQEGLFILGVDGMDPVISQRMISEGKLPNLEKLQVNGDFRPLATSTPPQSPVAWSTFVTGMDPGGHGLFDFIHRDPTTYLPISSATPPPGDAGTAVSMFGYQIPLSSPTVENNRSGTPFWDHLHAAGVDVEVYRIPGNYPTPPSNAKVLAGMGTVDMRGGYGTYTWYTDTPLSKQSSLKGDIQVITLLDNDLDGTPETARTHLKGPPDIFHLEPGAIPGANDYLTVPLTFHMDPVHDTVLIEAGTEQHLLQVGEWSEWVPLTFSALPVHLVDLQGMVQFYVKGLRPNVEIYASPVNITPDNPAQVITSPSEFALELHELVGPYFTQGMPEETNALSDGTFTDDDYVLQVRQVQDDSKRLLDVALNRFEQGDTTFFYLSDIDLQCHMLWRHGDPKDLAAPVHPAHDPETAPAHRLDIEKYYQHIDTLVGEVQRRLPPNTLLLLMSDHGFQPYTRKVHLNAWLRDNGWLYLKDNKRTGFISSGDIDWTRTKAYGLGFNGLYINKEGREGQGIVKPEEVKAITDTLAIQLTDWRDPLNDATIVLNVARAEQVYTSTRRAEAPDLIVGYNSHYGASEESTLGEITEQTLENNEDRWSGNHLMDPSVVPGVLFANRPISDNRDFSLPDVTATVLHHYQLQQPAEMVGQPIFR
jgi:predicted AlkP superfamily phosphohydrolase/phosphomutase